MVTAVRNIRTTLEMIKIEHTLFALPFALLGAVLAAQGLPTARQALWITLAMVGARSAAMAFNRIADRAYDAANPRTATRAIPAGQLSLPFAWAFTAAAAALFFLAAAMLNRLTLLLAPVALASVLLYSYTKRFTSLSHVAGALHGLARSQPRMTSTRPKVATISLSHCPTPLRTAAEVCHSARSNIACAASTPNAAPTSCAIT
jgi:4-hydroxybenzoate polyprenyltransferase